RNWSTIVLMVFLSSSTSPFTSTVIFFERSPFATAVVTSAMFLTWPVRLPAMEFTESVRSFHVPATPFTFAWPPSLPSVPTSRATRVTSEAKEPSCSTILLIVFAVRRNSPSSAWPSTSRAIVCERSPWATAPITRAVSLVGCTRSSMRSFTQSIDSRQKPRTSPMSPRCLSLPSLPTFWRRRASSSLMRPLSSTTSLNVSASLPSRPVHAIGRRTLLSPCLSAMSAFRMTPVAGAGASAGADFAGAGRARLRAATADPVSFIVRVGFMSAGSFLGSASDVSIERSYLVLDVAAQLGDRALHARLVELARLEQVQPSGHRRKRRSQLVGKRPQRVPGDRGLGGAGDGAREARSLGVDARGVANHHRGARARKAVARFVPIVDFDDAETRLAQSAQHGVASGI